MATNVGFNSHFDHAKVSDALQHMLMNGANGSAGMAIKTAGSAIAKFANTVAYMINGVFYSKSTADVTIPATTIPTGYKAFVAAFLDASGNVTSVMTTPVLATSTDAIVLPTYADTKCCIGGVLISNASGSNFVGATTALDTANVTTTYLNFGTAFPGMAVA